jgi:hypothetical protein
VDGALDGDEVLSLLAAMSQWRSLSPMKRIAFALRDVHRVWTLVPVPKRRLSRASLRVDHDG